MKTPKNILITGASSGIGEALALYYAAPEITLFLSGRDKVRLDNVGTQCQARGATVNCEVIDVTDQQAMETWIDQISKTHPLDLVIANAGISGGTGGVMEGEEFGAARKIFDVNLMGVINTIEPAVKKMQAQDVNGNSNNIRGQVAIVSSLAGFRGWSGAPAYSASKGAVRFYGEALRGSLKESGIEVNVICPGFVTSRMTDVNKYKMPMKMSAEKAASIIGKGLARNKGRIAFPWPVHFFAWFIGILPDGLAQIILNKMPAKSAC